MRGAGAIVVALTILYAPLSAASATCPAPLQGKERWEGQNQWRALEQAGYSIGAIRIRVDDVYDTPSEDQRWYERAANKVHINSSDGAVRAAVTVEPGERVDANRVYQAERNLRELDYLLDARITPIACANETVDILVHVHDAWTLTVSAGFGSSGGNSRSHAELEDQNFLGTGKTVTLDYMTDIERTTKELAYDDPNVFGSDWVFQGEWQTLSDGNAHFGALDYPFRTFGQPWAFAIRAGDRASTLYFYQNGETAWTADSVVDEQDIRVRRLLGYNGDNGWRFGIGWHREKFDYSNLLGVNPASLPEPTLTDRALSGAYVLIERFHDHYAGFRNIRAMDRHEDYNLGFNLGLLLGNYAIDTGSSEDAPFIDTRMSYGSRLFGQGLLLAGGSYTGRRNSDGFIGVATQAGLTAYIGVDEVDTWVARIEGNWLDEPDPEQQLYIGGLEGLFGYPEHFRNGSANWKAQTEYRRISDAVLFRTLRVGYSAFLQGAQARSMEGEWGDTFWSVGAAFRLGNLRGSNSDTIYMGIAVPLVDAENIEGWQWLVTSEVSF